MGISSGGIENVALSITTSADTAAIDVTRTKVSGLAAATETATQEIVDGAKQAAAAETTLAAATEKATAAGTKHVATAAQVGTAWAKAGDDFEKFKSVLREIVVAEEQTAVATAELTAATTRAETATTAAVAAETKQAVTLTEVVAATEAKIAATTQETAAQERSVAATAKVPASARTAANAISILTQAAVTGTGGMAGMANAAGSLAFGVSAMVPELALAAAGIGAVVTVATALYQAFTRDTQAVYDFTGALVGSLDQLEGASTKAIVSAQLRTDAFLQQANEKVSGLRAALKSLEDSLGSGGITAIPGTLAAIAKTKGELSEQEAIQKQFADRALALQKLFLARSKEDKDRAADEDKQRMEELQRIREQDLRRAQSLEQQLLESRQSALDKVALSEEEAAIARVVREESRREAEIRALQINEDLKTRLLVLAQEDRDAQIAAIHKASRDKEAEEQRRADEEAARRMQQAIDDTINVMSQAFDAATRNGESYISAVTKMLMTPLARYLEGLAEREFVEAAVEAAFFNFAAAGRHLAVGGLALAASRKVSQIGGLNSGGGGGGGGSSASTGSGGGSSSLAPRERDRAGTTVINLITTDPYNGENIAITNYYLERSRITNRPIVIPPTTGLRQGSLN